MKYKASALVYELIKVDGNLMTELKTAQTNKGANLTAKEIAAVVASGVTDIGSRLELFVDDTLIDTQNTTADLQVMKPTFGGQVLDLSGGFVCKDIANSDYSGAFDPSRITEDTRPWENLGADYGNVIKVGDKYLYYYRGVDDEVTTVTGYTSSKDGRPLSHYMNVCVAESEDGIRFRRVMDEPVLFCERAWEGFSVMNPCVLYENGKYRMWYAAGETYEPNVLAYAESKDGLHWSKSPINPIFVKDTEHPYEADRIGGCYITKTEDMDYVMFYIGYRDIHTANICVAKSPDGLTRWEKSRFNPLVVPTPDGWDAAACYKPSVLWDEKENRWMLWYNGRVGHDERIGLVLKTGRELF
jgi:predicted GH43/DUF377 family glycosyl hydrolase